MEGLQRAKVLGRERDIYFGMPAIEYVHERMPSDYFERLEKGEFSTKDIKVTAHFVYAGLMGGAERKDEPLDLTFSDVYSLIETIYIEGDTDNLLQKVSTAYVESKTIKNAVGKLVKKNEGLAVELTGPE